MKSSSVVILNRPVDVIKKIKKVAKICKLVKWRDKTIWITVEKFFNTLQLFFLYTRCVNI